jgi:hypothetical protein
MSSSDNRQIDAIVQAVLERLGRTADAPSGNVAAVPASNIGELTISDNVVSAKSLEGKLTNIQKVVVSARAVITPSARDLLRDKNVSITRALKTSSTSPTQLILGTAGVKLDTSALLRALAARGSAAEQLPAVGLAQVTHELADAVAKGGKLAVLLTNNVTAAVCLANRHSGVRAATATNRGEVNEVIRAVGCNLLVIDATRRQGAESQRIVEVFASAPPRQCPADLKASLE